MYRFFKKEYEEEAEQGICYVKDPAGEMFCDLDYVNWLEAELKISRGVSERLFKKQGNN